MGRRRILVAVVVALALWGCSGDGGTAGGYLSGSGTSDGFRVHRFHPGGGMDAIVSGVVEVDLDTDCVWLSDPEGTRYPVVWPVGASARSDPFAIAVGKDRAVEPGDRVEGGGGYISADSATRRLGLEPFPTECVHVGTAAVFNADSPIKVTAGVGLELVETLADRFSLPTPIGLELIAVDADAPSVAVIDFVTGTVHQYESGRYHGPKDSIDGVSGGGGAIHLWSEGTIYSYGWLNSEPLVYQPRPLSQATDPTSTLVVLPAKDPGHPGYTWLVQPGVSNDVTLVELVNPFAVGVTRLMSTGIKGTWEPVGTTLEGLVLITDEPEPITRLVSSDGNIRTEVRGTALSVGWNGAAILRPDGSLIVSDANLDNPTRVDKPGMGKWMPVGGPPASTTSPPDDTSTDQFLVILADKPEDGPLSAGRLMVVGADGRPRPIFELSHGPHIASWSRDEHWVVVVEGSSVTLINMEDGSINPLGVIVPDSHWVFSAG